MSIAIGGLFYNSSKYLDKYFNHLLAFKVDKKLLHLRFVVTASEDGTEKAVEAFKVCHGTEYASVQIEKIERTGSSLVANVANAWNTLARISSPHNLIGIEHDCGASQDAISRLISSAVKSDIVAGITVTLGERRNLKLEGGAIASFLNLPQVTAVIKTTDGFHTIAKSTPGFQLIFVPKVLHGKTIEVDGVATGLIYLSRKVLDSISFDTDDFTSADLAFCTKAKKVGFKVLVDTSLWYDHYHYEYKMWVEGGRRFILFQNGSFANSIPCCFIFPKQSLDAIGIPVEQITINVNDSFKKAIEADI